jgi:hypothetical protein
VESVLLLEIDQPLCYKRARLLELPVQVDQILLEFGGALLGA